MTQPIAPQPLVRPLSHAEQMADQAVRDAMNAALAGDFALVDQLEVTYLNVLVRAGVLVMRDAEGERHPWHAEIRDPAWAPFIVAYHRRYGAACRPALEWQLRRKCRRCEGKLRRLECRICDGRWYVDDSDDHELVYTDVDGFVVEDRWL